eukprot:g118.t1
MVGCGVVHITGGAASLGAAHMLGPRLSFRTGDGIKAISPLHVGMGCFMLWATFIAFNGALNFDAYAMVNVFFTTVLASCGGALASIIVNYLTGTGT